MKLSIICPTLQQRNKDGEIYIEKVIENILMQSDDIFTYFDDFEFITIRNELVNP
jgi:hypothetical protein